MRVCHDIHSSGLYFNWFGHADCGYSRVKTYHCAPISLIIISLCSTLIVHLFIYDHPRTKNWNLVLKKKRFQPHCYFQIGDEKYLDLKKRSQNILTLKSIIVNVDAICYLQMFRTDGSVTSDLPNGVWMRDGLIGSISSLIWTSWTISGSG